MNTPQIAPLAGMTPLGITPSIATPTKLGLALVQRDAALEWRNQLDKYPDYHNLPRWKQLEKYDQATRKAQAQCKAVNRLADFTLQLFC